MKRVFNLTGFYPFERQQFQDYLNDMAKKGYHLKKFNSYLSEYKEDQNEIYYHVAIHEKSTLFIEPQPDQDFIELFEQNGYQFVDRTDIFYIFSSQKKNPIYTDETIDQEIVHKESKKHLCIQLIASLTIVLFMYLFGLIPLSFNDFTYQSGFLMPILIIILTLVVILTSYYYLHYFFFQSISYSYQTCLYRSYLTQFLCFLMIFHSLIINLITQNYILIYIIVFPLLAFLISFISRKKAKPLALQSISILTYGLGIVIVVVSIIGGWNLSYTPPQLPLVSHIEDEGHTLFLDYYHYYINDYDSLKYAKSLKTSMSGYLLQKLIDEDDLEYTHRQYLGYDLYQSTTTIIVYRTNQMLKVGINNIKNLDQFLKQLNW